jgi:hypothetical protein
MQPFRKGTVHPDDLNALLAPRLDAEPGSLETVLGRLKDRARSKATPPFYENTVGGSVAAFHMAEVVAQGSYLRVYRHANPGKLNQPGEAPRRGIISTFSAASRKRLIDLFAKFDRRTAKRGPSTLFVTLTYPKMMTDHARAKRDLKVFMERLQERYKKMWSVWKMEYQESGSIHFHLMLGGVGYLPVNRPQARFDAQEAWNSITGTCAANSVDVERLRSINGVMWYVAKYMSKNLEETVIGAVNDNGPHSAAPHRIGAGSMGLSISHIFSQRLKSTGRFWGVYGRKNLPLATEKRYHMPVTENVWGRFLAKCDSEWCRNQQGFTIYTADSYRLAAWLDVAANSDGYANERRSLYESWRTLNRWWALPWERRTAHEQKQMLLDRAHTMADGPFYCAP